MAGSQRIVNVSVVSLSSIVRKLQSKMPTLQESYGIQSLGVFGSYARAQHKDTSDVDVLVEFAAPSSITEFLDLQEELSLLVGKKVYLHEPRQLKRYIAKNVERQVIWLQKDGVAQKTRFTPRAKSRKSNGGSVEPEREYLDSIHDMIESMENAPLHVEGMTLEQMLDDRKTLQAVRAELTTIGEAASRMPREVQARYPKIPWKDGIGTRHVVVHRYDGIDYETIWKILHESIPRDLPLVREMLGTELKRRNIQE